MNDFELDRFPKNILVQIFRKISYTTVAQLMKTSKWITKFVEESNKIHPVVPQSEAFLRYRKPIEYKAPYDLAVERTNSPFCRLIKEEDLGIFRFENIFLVCYQTPTRFSLLTAHLAKYGQTCDTLQITQLDQISKDDISEAVAILKPKSVIFRNGAPFQMVNLDFEGVKKLWIQMLEREVGDYLIGENVMSLVKKREIVEIECPVLSQQGMLGSFIRAWQSGGNINAARKILFNGNGLLHPGNFDTFLQQALGNLFERVQNQNDVTFLLRRETCFGKSQAKISYNFCSVFVEFED